MTKSLSDQVMTLLRESQGTGILPSIWENRIGTNNLLNSLGVLGIRQQQDEKQIILSLDVPGVAAEDISLSIDEDVLILTAVRKDTGKDLKLEKRWSVAERSADWDNATSELKNGVLTITIPKIEKKKNLITIQVT